jgi:hypothetical protein
MRSQILLLLSCEIVNHLVEKTLRTDKQLINYAQNMNILFFVQAHLTKPINDSSQF